MGNIKRHLHVATMIALIKRIVVDQVGAMDVKQGTEGQTVVPARTEVTDVHLIIASRLALTPKKQALLGRHALLVDVVNGESKNECPYKSEDNLPVTVHNVLCTNVRHLNATHLDEVEGQIGILEALDAQLWFGSVAAKRFLGKTFEQVNQYYAIAEILYQVLDLQIPHFNLCVEPFGKCLLLDRNPSLLFSVRHPGKALLVGRLDGGKSVCGARMGSLKSAVSRAFASFLLAGES